MTKQCSTTFSKCGTDHLHDPLFLSDSGIDISRTDVVKYPSILKIDEKMRSLFWVPEEIGLGKDKSDFQKLSEPEQQIFTETLLRATMLDSIQGRSPTICLLPICSNPELELAIECWAFFECLAEGTEVLTTEGWKDLGDVTIENKCLVYDLSTEEVFFENPKRVVEYDADIPMIEYVSKNKKQFHQLVTPNHRMPVIHRDGKGNKTRYFKEAAIQDYASHHLAPISGSLVGGTQMVLSPLERLLIATQADGTVSNRYSGERCKTLPIWFSLSKQRKIDRLFDICNHGSFELTELTPDKRNTNRRFKVNLPVDLFSGDAKSFDWVNLDNVTNDWCEQFMYELSQWDSHRHGDEYTSTFTYTTTNKNNADIVQALSAMCGRSPRMSVLVDNRKETYKDVYSINIIPKKYKDGQSIEKKVVEYNGKVRCLETSTGAFLIRYNGVVSVSGNTIHSKSYSHIIKNIFPNPTKVFDSLMDISGITDCATSISEYYDNLDRYNAMRTLNHADYDLYEHKKALYAAITAINALEAIRFYSAFAVFFNYGENSLMQGNAKILQLIARDESLHVGITSQLLKLLPKEDPDYEKIKEESRQEFVNIYNDVVQQEIDWVKYIFSKGSILGLNEAMLSDYIYYLGRQKIKSFGFDDEDMNFPIIKSNPLPWMDNWLNTGKMQSAPQEIDNINYQSGILDHSGDDDLSDFEL